MIPASEEGSSHRKMLNWEVNIPMTETRRIDGARSLHSEGPIAGEGGVEQKKFQHKGEVIEGEVFEQKMSQPSTIQRKGSVEVSKTITSN